MSKHIDELPSGKYRLRLRIKGHLVTQTYETIDEARWVRNQLLNHPLVGGVQAQAFLLSLSNPVQQAA